MLHFNRSCWLLFVGVPFDYYNTKDIAAAISKWGIIISWEIEDARRGRILVKARVTELIDIMKSIRWSGGKALRRNHGLAQLKYRGRRCLEVVLLMKIPSLHPWWTQILPLSLQ